MEPLPFIDEHGERVHAGSAAVWAALVSVLRRSAARGEGFARVLGCDPAAGTSGFDGRAGEAVPGFRVAAAEPGRRLELRGRHRFATYALTFRLEGDRLLARTHAEFPGLRGALYRALVIGSGAHRHLTRRLLRRIARAAEGPGMDVGGAPARSGEKSEP